MATKSQSRLTGAIFIVGAQAIVLVLGYATHLWIGRVLGPAAYGVFGVVLSLQTIVGLLLTLGIPVAVSRFVAQDEAHAQSILKQGMKIQLVVALTVSASLLLLSSWLARLLGDAALTTYIAFNAVVILGQAFYPIQAQFLSGMHMFSRQAALTAFYAMIKVVGALSLIYFIHIYGAFAGFLIGGLAAGLLGWYWTRGLGGAGSKTFPLKDFLSFAGTFALVLFGLQILISLDLFMVKALLRNDTQAGYYNAAVTLSRISYTLLQSLGFILLPSVAKLTKPGQSHDEAAKFISSTIRYLIALIVPSVVLAAATSKSLIMLFYSSKFIPAAPPLTILMVGLGALGFFLLLANIVAGAGKPAITLWITLLLIVISAASGAWLIPHYGLMGAASQTALAGIAGLAILGIYTFRHFRIPLPYASIARILAASFLAVLPTYFWPVSALLLPPLYVVSGIVYIAALILLGEVTLEDRRQLARIHPLAAKLAAVPPDSVSASANEL